MITVDTQKQTYSRRVREGMNDFFTLHIAWRLLPIRGLPRRSKLEALSVKKAEDPVVHLMERRCRL